MIQVEVEQRRRIGADSNNVLNQSGTKTIDNNPSKDLKPIEKDNYSGNIGFFDPFEIGITMWRNYYLFFLNLTKEISKNTIKITKDIENTIQGDYKNKYNIE